MVTIRPKDDDKNSKPGFWNLNKFWFAGAFGLAILSAIAGKKNISFFDSYWALIHFISGIIVGLVLLKLKVRKFYEVGFILLFLWETVELALRTLQAEAPGITESLKRVVPEFYFQSESGLNILSDLILGSLGLVIAHTWAKKRLQGVHPFSREQLR